MGFSSCNELKTEFSFIGGIDELDKLKASRLVMAFGLYELEEDVETADWRRYSKY